MSCEYSVIIYKISRKILVLIIGIFSGKLSMSLRNIVLICKEKTSGVPNIKENQNNHRFT